jgi:hypothetical protein
MIVMAAIMKAIAASLIVNKIKTPASPCINWADQNHGAARNTQCETCTQWRCAASITAFHHELSPGSSPDFWQNSKSLVGMSGSTWWGHGSICTSTAYKGCQTSYIYVIWMWDEYGLGLQPQSPHFTIIYQLRLAQICDKIPQARSNRAAVTWCGHIHMHIHSI